MGSVLFAGVDVAFAPLLEQSVDDVLPQIGRADLCHGAGGRSRARAFNIGRGKLGMWLKRHVHPSRMPPAGAAAATGT